MRSSLDVLRSAKKYVADLVLPEYEVRLSSEEGAWERPFCRVAWSTPLAALAHGARQTELRRTLSLVCWPPESETPDLARVAAEDVVERLLVAFAVGNHAESYNTNTGRAHPLRIPVWDFASFVVGRDAEGDVFGEVPLNQTTLRRAPTDFASVIEQPNVGDVRDPNTDLSRLVTCDLRLRWMRAVGVPIAGPLSVAPVVGFQP